MMTDAIKQIVKNYIENMKPCMYVFGIVMNSSPLIIKIDEKITLVDGFYTLTETVSKKNLLTGDKLVLLRQHGGNSYLVIDKVV